MDPVASNLMIKRGVSTQLNKMNSKSTSMSDSSSSVDEFYNKSIQPNSYVFTISKAPVVYDSKHGMEEETNDKEEVDRIVGNASWSQCGKCCSMQKS